MPIIRFRRWLLGALLLPAYLLGQPAPTYRLVSLSPPSPIDRPLEGLNARQLALLEKLNRADLKHLPRLPVLVMPDDWYRDEIAYCPLPAERPEAREEAKAIWVDLPQQAFAAYEYGRLVRWGPVNSGAKKSPTPPGVYHLNWRSKRHVSTSSSEWILTWYFNFENRDGRAFHAYAMPGYPASHSCTRLLERDAEWLYYWGEKWEVSPDGRQVVRPGTRVVMEGTFDFAATPVWRLLGKPGSD